MICRSRHDENGPNSPAQRSELKLRCCSSQVSIETISVEQGTPWHAPMAAGAQGRVCSTRFHCGSPGYESDSWSCNEAASATTLALSSIRNEDACRIHVEDRLSAPVDVEVKLEARAPVWKPNKAQQRPSPH